MADRLCGGAQWPDRSFQPPRGDPARSKVYPLPCPPPANLPTSSAAGWLRPRLPGGGGHGVSRDFLLSPEQAHREDGKIGSHHTLLLPLSERWPTLLLPGPIPLLLRPASLKRALLRNCIGQGDAEFSSRQQLVDRTGNLPSASAQATSLKPLHSLPRQKPHGTC